METIIPFYGLDRFYEINSSKVDLTVKKVMSTGVYVDGIETKLVEKKLADYCHRKFCTTNSSGTDSLFFALLALGIGIGDEVLVPAISFIATATAITRIGALPVFVDINESDGLMDLKDAVNKITSRTKAVLFVDLYGNMPEVEELEIFAIKNGLLLIEDAAQALGSEKKGRRAGSIGDVSTLSFDPSKPVSAFGTGGAVLCNDSYIANACTAYRQNGKNPQNGKYDSFGINSRFSETQAALINLQMNEFETTLTQRRKLAKMYIDLLAGLPIDIMVKNQINYSGNFHKFVIRIDNRDDLRLFLINNGIETRIHYEECLYDHAVLAKYKSKCRNANVLKTKVLTLPFYTNLKEFEIDYICSKIKLFIK